MKAIKFRGGKMGLSTRPSPTMGMKPVQVYEADCAIGLIPRTGTARWLNIVLKENGRLAPAVTLVIGRRRRKIVFDQDFADQERFHSGSARKDFIENAMVCFEEGEPGGATCVQIIYVGMSFEKWVAAETLSRFIDYQPFTEILNDYGF
jgi:hypothetical protein